MSPVKERSEQQKEDTTYVGTGGLNLLDSVFKWQWRVCDVQQQEFYTTRDAVQGAVDVEMLGIGIPPWRTIQQELKIAQVQAYEPALRLLAELYDKVSLPVSELKKRDNEDTIIAVAMLAASGMCDVSPSTIRLSAEGKDFVEFLIGNNFVAVSEA